MADQMLSGDRADLTNGLAAYCSYHAPTGMAAIFCLGGGFHSLRSCRKDMGSSTGCSTFSGTILLILSKFLLLSIADENATNRYPSTIYTKCNSTILNRERAVNPTPHTRIKIKRRRINRGRFFISFAQYLFVPTRSTRGLWSQETP